MRLKGLQYYFRPACLCGGNICFLIDVKKKEVCAEIKGECVMHLPF